MPTEVESAERRHIEVMTGLFLIAARLDRIAVALRNNDPPDRSKVTDADLAAVLKDFEPLMGRMEDLWQVRRQ